MHGLKRAEAAVYPVPPLLDWLIVSRYIPDDRGEAISSRATMSRSGEADQWSVVDRWRAWSFETGGREH